MSLVDTTKTDGEDSTPSRPLYHSDWVLPDFQATAAAYGYERRVNLFVYDTGIGKSHIAMVTAAMLLEDHKVDLVVIVGEKNKMDRSEWPKDLDTFTDFKWVKYHQVPPKKRAEIRKSLPQVLLSTYETIKLDAVEKIRARNAKGSLVEKTVPADLTKALIEQCKSVLFVYDEITKLGNRKTDTYKAHEVMLTSLTKAGVEVRIMGLTATPVERGPENLFNVGRILIPDRMPTVAHFEERYVALKDFFGNFVRFRNLAADKCEPGITPLRDLFSGIVLRKQKTDADVIAQFPQVIEEPPMYVKLGDKHRDFYATVVGTFEDADEYEQRSLSTVLRQIAGHPMSLTLSQGKVARTITDTVGEAGLEALGSMKTTRLIEYLTPIIKGQGAQVVLFSFFTSVIHFVQRDLEKAGFTVAPFHGGLSTKEAGDNKAAWKAGEFEILFSSDAGARGINLPEGQYGIEYEMALTRANQVQRLNRIHRIDSKHPSVTFRSLVAEDTIEEGFAQVVLRRDEWAETLLDPEDPGEQHITSAMRKKLFQFGKRRAA